MSRRPVTYDITFCVSECKDKCFRHVSNYDFEPERNWISLADFNCEERDNDRPEKCNRES